MASEIDWDMEGEDDYDGPDAIVVEGDDENEIEEIEDEEEMEQPDLEDEAVNDGTENAIQQILAGAQ